MRARPNPSTALGQAARLAVATTSLLGFAALGLSAATTASAVGTSLISETFDNANVSAPASWIKPAAPMGDANIACLTAGTATTQTPIPDCESTEIDTPGNGVLRLTGAAGNEEGGVTTTASVPATTGIDANFDTYQYGGSGADGIGFVIAAENPSDPVAPANIGQPGGDLGYSSGSSAGTESTGLAYGYLGVGLDVYGNYSNPNFSGTGCGTAPTWADVQTPGQVVTRGPGNGSTGYCPLNSSLNGNPGTSQVLTGGASGTRAGSLVPVEVVFNTTGASVNMTGTGFTANSVPAGDYGVAWTPIGGSAHFYDGALPTVANDGIPSGLYPSGWLNPTTGIPYQVGFGWVASTGDYTDVHEVSNVTVTSLQPTPVLTAAITDDQSGQYTQGGTGNLMLTAGVGGTVDEADPITMSSTLPAGLTPGTATGTGWTCTTTGQAVSCTESATVDSGTTLPAVTVPVTVAADASTTAGALTTDLTVSSSDGDPAEASDPGTAVASQGVAVPTYTAVAPTRICDTLPGNPSALSGDAAQCDGIESNAGETLAPGVPLTVNAGTNFGVPADATAVVVNLTAVGSTAQGYLTAYPTGATVPTASNVNFQAGQTTPNLAEIGLGTGADISVVSDAAVNVVVDLEGYESPNTNGAGLYNPLSSPARICDTRAGNPSNLSSGAAQCNGTPVTAATPYTVQVDGNGGVPATDVSAVVLNVTAADPAGPGYLTAYAEGGTVPVSSSLNYFSSGQNVANRVIVPVSTGGAVSLYASQNTNVVVDVSGWFTTAGGTGGSYYPLAAPIRICDTRPGNYSGLTGMAAQCNGTDGAGMPLGPNSQMTIQVTGLAGVPTDATAVVLNLTAIDPSAQTFLSVYPGPTRPTVSDLNPRPGTDLRRANLVVATVSPGGTVTIYNYTGTLNLAVDISGWYTSATPV